MTISNCPKCAQQVTMPDGGRSDWQVKCPLCQEEFSLGEMLERLPPALIVISGVPAVSAAAADDEFATLFAGEAGTTTGDVFELDSTEGEVPSFTLAGDDGGAAVATAPAMSKVTTIPRRKKKEKNIAVELMKVVIGGAAGLLIGFFLLLWVWEKDILQVAPKFPAWAQWALPAGLRKAPPSVTPISTAPETNPQPSETPDPDAPADAMPDDAAPKEESIADADKPQDASEAEKPIVPADDSKEAEAPKEDEKPADPDAEKKPEEKPADAKKEKPIDTDDPLDITPPDADKKIPEPKIPDPKIDEPKLEEPKIDIPKIDEPKIDEPKIEEPKTDDPAKSKTPDDAPKDDEKVKPDDEKVEPKPEDADEVGLKVAEAVTAEQIESARKAASEALETLTPGDATQKSAFTPEKYAAYGKICEAVAAVARAGDDFTDRDRLKVMLLIATNDEEHAAVIGQLANAWLARARKNDGIVLVGKVEEVSAAGPLKTAKVQLPGLGAKLPAMQVTVVSKELPELKAGDAIDVAGVIVEKPTDRIKGFKGENKRVIWATHVNARGTNETGDAEKPADAEKPTEAEKPAEKPAE